jgi:hypothetical protein
VIQQLAGRGIPIQVLVNKKDRVSQEIDRLMAYIHSALESTQIPSLEPPVALSARLALKGRMGDDAALAESGWDQVEALLSCHIVDRRDELRERALRRKACALALELAAIAEERAHEGEQERRQAEARRERCLRAAGTLRAERVQLAESLSAELVRALQQLRQDVRPIAELDEERRSEPAVRDYVVDATVRRLTPALAAALQAQTSGPLANEPLGEWVIGDWIMPAVRATLAGAAAAYRGVGHLQGEPLRGAVERAVVEAAAALERQADAPLPPSPSEALSTRLAAVAAALGATRSADGSGASVDRP